MGKGGTTSPRRWSWLTWAGAAGLLAASAVFSPGGLPRLPLCWVKRVAGLPCPGCGLTRSIAAISHGQWADAWAFNPFGFAVYLILIGCLVYPLVAARYPRAAGTVTHSRAAEAGSIAFVAALTGFWVARILAG